MDPGLRGQFHFLIRKTKASRNRAISCLLGQGMNEGVWVGHKAGNASHKEFGCPADMKMPAAGRVPRPCIWDFDCSVTKEGDGKVAARGEIGGAVRPQDPLMPR